MPKRVGHLYEKMLDKGFIRTTVYRAVKGRTKRRDCSWVLRNLDGVVDNLYTMLLLDEYRPARYQEKLRYDDSSQKHRTIRTVPFYPDCLVQWLIVEAMKEKVFLRGMDYWCCASVPGRGGGRVFKGISHFIRHHHKSAVYCLQMDVHHFYDSIDIDILMDKLRRRCKDERFLSLMEAVVRASSENGKSGIGIGYNLNQWLANFFLEDIDRFIRTLPGVGFYVRYMDNMTIIGPNRRKLRRVRKAVEEKLGEISLELKGDWQVFPIGKRPVQAVGYRYLRSGKMILRKRNWLKLRRQCIRLAERQRTHGFVSPREARSFLSRIGAAIKHASPRRILSVASGIDLMRIRRIAA